MRWMRISGVTLGGMLALVQLACGNSEDSGSFAPGVGATPGSAPLPGPSLGTGGTSGDFGAGGAAPLPPEEEDESAFRAPVVTGRFLWTANPESGRVALIDGRTLEVQVLSAGLFPSYLAAVPSESGQRAIVQNAGSSDATLFHVQAGDVQSWRIETHASANRWTVSDSGRWVVAWSVAENELLLDPVESLQEITIIDLAGDRPKSKRLTAGYRPSQVQVNAEENQLSVVSEEGITLIRLTGEEADEAEVDGYLPLSSQGGKDVSLTEDGQFALVRLPGSSQVEIYDLDSLSQELVLDFDDPVTDLDLSASGRVVAVIRSESRVETFFVDDVFNDANDRQSIEVDGELFGSAALAPTGDKAVLFTNAVDNDRVTVLDLSEEGFGEVLSFDTKTPVQSVRTSPDGKHAVVLGQRIGQGAFSVLSLTEERFPRIVGTQTPVETIAVGNEAVVVATSGGAPEAYLVSLPGLSERSARLASVPISAGLVPSEDLAYIAQNHPEGRMTFFELETAKARTLTGFELAAEVVDE